jgi:hypothetical protein
VISSIVLGGVVVDGPASAGFSGSDSSMMLLKDQAEKEVEKACSG